MQEENVRTSNLWNSFDMDLLRSEMKLHKKWLYIPYLLISVLNFITLNYTIASKYLLHIFHDMFLVVTWIFVAVPMCYVEIFLGQYTKMPLLSGWKMAPISYGGFWYISIMSLITGSLKIFYPVLCFYMFCKSMMPNVPWFGCKKQYGDPDLCFDVSNSSMLSEECTPHTFIWYDITCLNKSYIISTNQYALYLYLDPNIDRSPYDSAQLVFCSIFIWILVYILLLKSTYNISKVVRNGYIIFCIGLIVFFIVIITDDKIGSIFEGKRVFLTLPLSEFDLPAELYFAIYGGLSSLSVANPSAWTYSSKVGFKTDALEDSMIFLSISCVVILICNSLLFLLEGIFILSLGLRPEAIPTAPMGISLVSYLPAAAARSIHAGKFWLTFSLLLFTFVLVMNSIIVIHGNMENFIIGSGLRNYRKYVVTIYFVIAVIFSGIILSGKKYSQKWIMSDLVLVSIVSTNLGFAVESLVVFWIYGVSRLCDDMQFMCGREPSLFWKVCWSICPVVGLFVSYTQFKFTIASTEHLVLFDKLLIYGTVLIIPLGAIIKAISFRLDGRSLWLLLVPASDWGPPNRYLKYHRNLFHPKEEIRSQPFITKRVVLKKNVTEKMKFQRRKSSSAFILAT